MFRHGGTELSPWWNEIYLMVERFGIGCFSQTTFASASICWMNTTEHLMTLTNNQNKGGSAYSMLIPNLRRYLDYPHTASIACPKPALFFNGSKDKLFPIEGVKDAYQTMRTV